MWPDLQIRDMQRKANFRQPGGASVWHTDLVHEAQPAGVTHLHNDTVPEVGGDTLWSSGMLLRWIIAPKKGLTGWVDDRLWSVR